MEKRWKILENEPDKTDALQKALGVQRAVCSILVQRGIDSFAEAKDFFRPDLAMLHDPFLMKDMQLAVDRILLARSRGEQVLVFGDYDVDGTTAVACMYQFLSTIFEPGSLAFYIPHRYREGYGVSQAGIDFAASQQMTLIISLDCGIKSVEHIRYAASLGIHFIVCDHHLPDSELPPAVAILNPKQADCTYPYKELCGCGVGFKLICALAVTLGKPLNECYEYLDLVATAIAADIVPMTGENRVLTWFGLAKANSNPNHGIAALKKLSGLNENMQISNLVFMIAPRVNAAGRMDDARKAVEMFIAPDIIAATRYAEQLHSDNTDRKEADSSITEEALAIIGADEILIKRNTTVVFQPHWHKGVVGIVASRLIERYYRPTVVLTRSGEIVAGSARSVIGFNLYEAIHACRQHLLGYGGHFAAAGMTLHPDQVTAFADRFEAIVSATIDPALLIPVILIDEEIAFSEINQVFYKILHQMEPFGPGNARPIFICRNLYDTGYSKVVKGDHIRFSLKQQQLIFTGIGFNLAHKFNLLLSGKVDVVCCIDENEWNGNKNLQLKVIDLKPSIQPIPVVHA